MKMLFELISLHLSYFVRQRKPWLMCWVSKINKFETVNYLIIDGSCSPGTGCETNPAQFGISRLDNSSLEYVITYDTARYWLTRFKTDNLIYHDATCSLRWYFVILRPKVLVSSEEWLSKVIELVIAVVL